MVLSDLWGLELKVENQIDSVFVYECELLGNKFILMVAL